MRAALAAGAGTATARPTAAGDVDRDHPVVEQGWSAAPHPGAVEAREVGLAMRHVALGVQHQRRREQVQDLAVEIKPGALEHRRDELRITRDLAERLELAPAIRRQRDADRRLERRDRLLRERVVREGRSDGRPDAIRAACSTRLSLRAVSASTARPLPTTWIFWSISCW
jgi:hypothetical protein